MDDCITRSNCQSNELHRLIDARQDCEAVEIENIGRMRLDVADPLKHRRQASGLDTLCGYVRYCTLFSCVRFGPGHAVEWVIGLPRPTGQDANAGCDK
jgi:hypothetical protein